MSTLAKWGDDVTDEELNHQTSTVGVNAAVPTSPQPQLSPNPQTSSKPSKLCLFFLKGTCAFGDNCNLSHDIATQHRIPICKYFLTQTCSFGDKCLYRHEQEEPKQPRHTQPRNNNTKRPWRKHDKH